MGILHWVPSFTIPLGGFYFGVGFTVYVINFSVGIKDIDKLHIIVKLYRPVKTALRVRQSVVKMS